MKEKIEEELAKIQSEISTLQASLVSTKEDRADSFNDENAIFQASMKAQCYGKTLRELEAVGYPPGCDEVVAASKGVAEWTAAAERIEHDLPILEKITTLKGRVLGLRRRLAGLSAAETMLVQVKPVLLSPPDLSLVMASEVLPPELACVFDDALGKINAGADEVNAAFGGVNAALRMCCDSETKTGPAADRVREALALAVDAVKSYRTETCLAFDKVVLSDFTGCVLATHEENQKKAGELAAEIARKAEASGLAAEAAQREAQKAPGVVALRQGPDISAVQRLEMDFTEKVKGRLVLAANVIEKFMSRLVG